MGNAGTFQVVLADVLCASFEDWLPGSRPVLSVWKMMFSLGWTKSSLNL